MDLMGFSYNYTNSRTHADPTSSVVFASTTSCSTPLLRLLCPSSDGGTAGLLASTISSTIFRAISSLMSFIFLVVLETARRRIILSLTSSLKSVEVFKIWKKKKDVVLSVRLRRFFCERLTYSKSAAMNTKTSQAVFVMNPVPYYIWGRDT